MEESKQYSSFEEIKRQKHLLEIQERLYLQQSLTSTDPEAILKAQVYLDGENKKRASRTKAFLYAPQNEFLGASGFRMPMKSVSYRTLRMMARTPVVRVAVGTRNDQVAAYAEPTDNVQEKGWMIQKRLGATGTADKKTVNMITKSIMDGGFTKNIWEFDSFEAILRQMARDSLELDQICIEIVENKRGQVVEFKPVDAATIRLVDPESSQEKLPEKYGYQAKYVQEWNSQLYNYFFPWEMSFGIRNKSTDIWTNGYGISELEDLIQVVTGLLNACTYNFNYFTQGSNPKGFFAIKGNLGHNTVADFQQEWRNTIAGVQNSHRVPVIESPDGEIQWIDFMQKNVDMEFSRFLEFLIVMVCCVFKIDPSECGWNFGKMANSLPFGQDGQKQRLKHSQSKGLVPLLKLLQRVLTKYWVRRIDDDYEFVFTGVEQDDKVTSLDMDVKKAAAGFVSQQDMFEKWSGRAFDPDKDTILNPIYQQIVQAQMMQEQQEAMMGGEGGEGEQPEGNPFDMALKSYATERIGLPESVARYL